MQSSGANLNKLWSALNTLRDILVSSRANVVDIPDPLPAPSSMKVYNTRGFANVDGVHVAYTAQMIPVVLALIEAASATKKIHDMLDAGADEVKENQTLARAAAKKEKERWEAEGGGKGKVRPILHASLESMSANLPISDKGGPGNAQAKADRHRLRA
jgi:hypothetical protein